jgi:transcriptional regulator GlxA family with amidase domain
MSSPSTDQTTTHTIGFLLTPEFSMIAFTSSIEPLRLANLVSGQKLFAWRIYSPDGNPVAASNGLRIEADGSFNDVGPMPEIIVCSGVNVHKHDHTQLIARLRRLSFYGVSIGAVCTGAYILAKAGLLDGYRCTIHWENSSAFREEFPDIELTDELFEFDRNRFTCAGGTAAIDMMLSLIADRKGADIAALVTDELIHHRMRAPNERQRMDLRARLGVANPKILTVAALMEENLEEPLSCSTLAKRAGLSPRQLERLFRKYIGETPTRYYLRLRLEKARQLLRQTSMPILSVGLACGFISASHFSSSYSHHFGKTPSEERSAVRRKKTDQVPPPAHRALDAVAAPSLLKPMADEIAAASLPPVMDAPSPAPEGDAGTAEI